MKKLLTIVTIFVTGLLQGCGTPKNFENDASQSYKTNVGVETNIPNGFELVIVDSCEYVTYEYGIFDQKVFAMTHKGNCKFCKQRLNK